MCLLTFVVLKINRGSRSKVLLVQQDYYFLLVTLAGRTKEENVVRLHKTLL